MYFNVNGNILDISFCKKNNVPIVTETDRKYFLRDFFYVWIVTHFSVMRKVSNKKYSFTYKLSNYL